MDLKNQIELVKLRISNLKAFREIRKKFEDKDVLMTNFELSDLDYEIEILEEILSDIEKDFEKIFSKNSGQC